MKQKFGRGTNRVPNRLCRVVRGFILASLLFYQSIAEMRAQRPRSVLLKNNLLIIRAFFEIFRSV